MLPYQKQLDQLLSKLPTTPPHLLLHSCCAPCSSYVIEYLSNYFSITLLYFNPNIQPQEEYLHRLAEQKRLLSVLPTRYPVRLLEGRYLPKLFLSFAEPLKSEPEGGARCLLCYQLRMEEAALAAAHLGADYFATTLSVSPHKNATAINEIGTALAAQYGVPHLPSDFKKKGGYQRSIQLSKEYALYRQTYCGCLFSMPAASHSE